MLPIGDGDGGGRTALRDLRDVFLSFTRKESADLFILVSASSTGGRATGAAIPGRSMSGGMSGHEGRDSSPMSSSSSKRTASREKAGTPSPGVEGGRATTTLHRQWKGFAGRFRVLPAWLGGGSDRDEPEVEDLGIFLDAIALEPAFGLERRASQDLTRALMTPSVSRSW